MGNEQKRNNTYVYEYKNALYFNLTNRCSNCCDFCVRNHITDLKERELWLNTEPQFNDIISAIPVDVSGYDEFVFCGYGEPTYRPELILAVSEYMRKFSKPIRINTNGQGNLINKKSIVEYLKYIDIVSISLNSDSQENYQKVCHSIFPDSYKAILDFATECKNAGRNVIFTLVDTISQEEIDNCKKIASDIGVPLRIRHYY